jgi:hypothetical protein
MALLAPLHMHHVSKSVPPLWRMQHLETRPFTDSKYMVPDLELSSLQSCEEEKTVLQKLCSTR